MAVHRWDTLSIKQWRAELTGLLLTSDEALRCALLRLYNCQTTLEKQKDETLTNNGMGFDSVDAPIFSKYARQLLETNYLSPRQMKHLRNRMPRYWKQLMIISKQKLGITD